MAESAPWHEDESFWETFREFLFPPEKLDEAPEQVDRLLDLLDLDAGAKVLDVPCGVGRHAVELADRGFRVTGVDATEPFLETARERAEDAAVDAGGDVYSAYELSELLRGVGFGDVTAYGDFEGSDYDENAEQLVVVARK